ncbi:MAG TPA: prenyltransferase/squalene oxidase repeat-containing protein [Gemmataceae bacterium]|nr:prenyltransferase/squalene oxidase repeat-containing protein [Gemmataceae bacterium]
MRKYFLTLVCVVGSCVPVLAQTPEQKKATVRFVQELQVADGGFAPAPVDSRVDKDPKGSLRATTSALRALKYFGGAPKDKAAVAKFVRSCFDVATNTFSDQPGGKPDVFSTAIGLMAEAELNIKLGNREISVIWLGENAKEFEDIRIAAAGMEAVGIFNIATEAWKRDLAAKANPDGSYGKGAETARATGGTIVTILRLNGKIKHSETIIEILNKNQNADGAFGKDDSGASDLETSYRVLRCYHMLKSTPANEAKLREFIAKCRNEDGGYGVQPGKPSQVGSTYFAAIILHWLDEK